MALSSDRTARWYAPQVCAGLHGPRLIRPSLVSLLLLLLLGLWHVRLELLGDLLPRRHTQRLEQYLHKLLVVDAPTGVRVGLKHHLLHLVLVRLLTQVTQNVPQLSCRDAARVLLVEDRERLLEHSVLVSCSHLHLESGCSLDKAILVDRRPVGRVRREKLGDLITGRVEAHRSHHEPHGVFIDGGGLLAEDLEGLMVLLCLRLIHGRDSSSK
mmetsp:Transcript_67977/g.134748  ORF Transcript_67977/g.134748 Transcript_67977/m.134748 type:complete len:213 (+) Transcript_67977:231-869(+)